MTTKTSIISIIYTANLTKDSINIISNQNDLLLLPQIDISTLDPKKHNLDLESTVQLLFERCVNLDFNWSKPKLLNIELIYDEEADCTTTAIYYGIYVPDNTKLMNNCYWIDIKPYIGYYETLRKLVCML
jgi:hypothetical protein